MRSVRWRWKVGDKFTAEFPTADSIALFFQNTFNPLADMIFPMLENDIGG